MKIAIIGSGFFGLTLGLFLSKTNEVHIFEKEKKNIKWSLSSKSI